GASVAKLSPPRGSSHSPLMKRPDFSWSWTMSRASGAGAYVQSVGIGAAAVRFATSVIGEVVLGLVSAGALLAHLHQDVVQQGRRAEPVEVGCEPLGAQRLVYPATQ